MDGKSLGTCVVTYPDGQIEIFFNGESCGNVMPEDIIDLSLEAHQRGDEEDECEE